MFLCINIFINIIYANIYYEITSVHIRHNISVVDNIDELFCLHINLFSFVIRWYPFCEGKFDFFFYCATIHNKLYIL